MAATAKRRSIAEPRADRRVSTYDARAAKPEPKSKIPAHLQALLAQERPISSQLFTRVSWESRNVPQENQKALARVPDWRPSSQKGLRRQSSAQSVQILSADQSEDSGSERHLQSPEPDLEELSSSMARGMSSLMAEAVKRDIQMYRRSCRQLDCVPIASFERAIESSVLSLPSHSIGPKGAQAIARALENNATIESLALPDCDIRAEGALAIATMLEENSYITKVDLSGNNILSRGMSALSHVLQGSANITHLNVAKNDLLDLDSPALCAALAANSTIVSLNLAHNRFGDLSGIRLAAALEANPSLTELDLSWNCLGRRGGTAVAASVKNAARLSRLNLASNSIGDSGAAALGSSLKAGSALTWLNVSTNGIHDTGAQALAAALPSSALTHLDVSHNPIGQAGLRALITAAASTPSLKTLKLDGMPLDAQTSQQLADLRAARPDMMIAAADPSPSASERDRLRDRLRALSEKYSQARLSLASHQSFRRPTVTFDRSWSAGKAWDFGYNANGSIRTDRQWLEGEVRNRRASILPQQSADDGDSSDEDDGNAFMRRQRDMARRFSILHPDLADPMTVLNDYIDSHRLRLVDIFFMIDKDRSGSLSVDELRKGFRSMSLALNDIQLEELIDRMDGNGDGEIDYHELCDTRRQLSQARLQLARIADDED